jgi:hypothetical protein
MASTWSCSVRRELLGCEAREQGAGFAFDYRHHTDGVISAAIGQLNASPRSSILLFKAHTAGPKTREWIGEGRIANIFTLRDFRDALA